MRHRLAALFLVTIAVTTLTGCAAFVDIDRARLGVSVLKATPRERSSQAEREQLLADQALIRATGGREAAVAALIAVNVEKTEAERRITAAFAAMGAAH